MWQLRPLCQWIPKWGKSSYYLGGGYGQPRQSSYSKRRTTYSRKCRKCCGRSRFRHCFTIELFDDCRKYAVLMLKISYFCIEPLSSNTATTSKVLNFNYAFLLQPHIQVVKQLKCLIFDFVSKTKLVKPKNKSLL